MVFFFFQNFFFLFSETQLTSDISPKNRKVLGNCLVEYFENQLSDETWAFWKRPTRSARNWKKRTLSGLKFKDKILIFNSFRFLTSAEFRFTDCLETRDCLSTRRPLCIGLFSAFKSDGLFPNLRLLLSKPKFTPFITFEVRIKRGTAGLFYKHQDIIYKLE